MHLDNNIKLIIGIVLIVVGAAWLLLDRRSRGFNQNRQAGLLALAVGILLVCVARGLIHF